MAKPVKGTPILNREAAEELAEYLHKAKPDPKKREQQKRDAAFHRAVTVSD